MALLLVSSEDQNLVLTLHSYRGGGAAGRVSLGHIPLLAVGGTHTFVVWANLVQVDCHLWTSLIVLFEMVAEIDFLCLIPMKGRQGDPWFLKAKKMCR